MRKYLKVLTLGLIGVLLISGCGSNRMSDYDYTTNELAELEEVKSFNGAMASSYDAVPQETITTNEASVSTNRKLITTLNFSIETTDIEPAKNQIDEAITKSGGYIESSDFDDWSTNTNKYNSTTKRYILTIRVDSNKLDTFLDEINGVGTIKSKSEEVKDITLEYSDVEGHKKTLEIEQNRLLELLEDATDIDTILAIEDKLSMIRYELENYTSQLKLYDNLVEYTTINITLSEVNHVQENGTSLGSRIVNGWNDTLYNLKEFGTDLLVFIITKSPLIIIIGILIFVIIKCRKKIKQKKNKEE